MLEYIVYVDQIIEVDFVFRNFDDFRDIYSVVLPVLSVFVGVELVIVVLALIDYNLPPKRHKHAQKLRVNVRLLPQGLYRDLLRILSAPGLKRVDLPQDLVARIAEQVWHVCAV